MAKDEKKPEPKKEPKASSERPGMTRRPDRVSSWRVSGYNLNPPIKRGG